MRKRKSFIGKLFGWIFGILITVVVAVAGVCIYVNKQYGINLFETLSEVKMLSQTVDESKVCDNKFSTEDMLSAQITANAKIENLITGNQTDGFKIAQDLTTSSILSGELALTDRQLGAIINELVNDEAGGLTVNFGTDSTKVDILQIKFENVDNSTGSADLNIVIKVDMTFLKEKLTSFPLNLFESFIPKALYISSTSTITKGDTAFDYSVESKSIKINNLDETQTADLFKTLNLLAKTGEASELNQTIGELFANMLIGNQENPNGFAYQLKDCGVADYTFKTDGNNNYFVIKTA